MLFPVKLHCILNESDESIVSWTDNGRCFVIHNPPEFVHKVLPRWFRLSKFASFRRQLSLYQFRRVTCGRNKGGYRHELFLRDKPDIARSIVRGSHQETRAKAQKQIQKELWLCAPIHHALPFLTQLRLVLDHAPQNRLDHIVSWVSDGKSFTIHQPKEFCQHVLPRFFGECQLLSFQCQLNLHGFVRVTRGHGKGSYYSEDFYRGNRDADIDIERGALTVVSLPANAVKGVTSLPVKSETIQTDSLQNLASHCVRKRATIVHASNVATEGYKQHHNGVDMGEIVDRVFFADDSFDSTMMLDFCSDWTPRGQWPSHETPGML